MDPLVLRINALSKKSKAEGLTAAELEEQAKLRRTYINQVKKNLVQTLENTSFIGSDGKEIPVKQKDKPLH